MNYEPNTTEWQFGDVVIHDADRKEWKMLMHVIEINVDGKRTTSYMFPDAYREGFPGRGFYTNHFSELHDPARFGIVIPDDQPKDGYL